MRIFFQLGLLGVGITVIGCRFVDSGGHATLRIPEPGCTSNCRMRSEFESESHIGISADESQKDSRL